MTLSKNYYSIYTSCTLTFQLITYTLPKAILFIGISQKNRYTHKKRTKLTCYYKKKYYLCTRF